MTQQLTKITTNVNDVNGRREYKSLADVERLSRSSPGVDMPRVGIIALLQESNTFLDRKTSFEDVVLSFGDDVLAKFENAPHEVGGFIEGLKGLSIEVVPIFAARAHQMGSASIVVTDMEDDP